MAANEELENDKGKHKQSLRERLANTSSGATGGSSSNHTRDVGDDIEKYANKHKDMLSQKDSGDSKNVADGANKEGNNNKKKRDASALHNSIDSMGHGESARTRDVVDDVKNTAEEHKNLLHKNQESQDNKKSWGSKAKILASIIGKKIPGADKLIDSASGGKSFVSKLFLAMISFALLLLPMMLVLCLAVIMAALKVVVNFIKAIITDIFGIQDNEWGISSKGQDDFEKYCPNDAYKEIANCFSTVIGDAYGELTNRWEDNLRSCWVGDVNAVSDAYGFGNTMADDRRVFDDEHINDWGWSLAPNIDHYYDPVQRTYRTRYGFEYYYDENGNGPYDIGEGHEAVDSYADNWASNNYSEQFPNGPILRDTNGELAYEQTDDGIEYTYLTGHESFFNYEISSDALIDQCDGGQIRDMAYLVCAYNMATCELPLSSSSSWFAATFNSYRWDITERMKGHNIQAALESLVPEEYREGIWGDNPIYSAARGIAWICDQGNVILSYLMSFIGVDADAITNSFFQYNAYLEMLGSYQRQVVRYVRKFDIDDSDENNVSVSYSEDQDVSREDCDDKGSLIWLNKPVAKSYELNSQLSIEQKNDDTSVGHRDDYFFYQNGNQGATYDMPTVTYNSDEDRAMYYYNNYLNNRITFSDSNRRLVRLDQGNVTIGWGNYDRDGHREVRLNPPDYDGLSSTDTVNNRFGWNTLRDTIGDSSVFTINNFFKIALAYNGDNNAHIAKVGVTDIAAERTQIRTADNGEAVSAFTNYSSTTDDFHNYFSTNKCTSDDNKKLYFVYFDFPIGTNPHTGEMNYRPILCMLVKDSSVSGDSLGKNGVNFASLPAYSYYLDDLCVCPNGTPSASDLYGIIRVNDDNLEDAYNRYSNGFTINVGDLSVEETGTVTRSFDMTVRIPTTASYNMYYMRAYGSPVNTNGIIFLLFAYGQYKDVDGNDYDYYSDDLQEFKLCEYTDENGVKHTPETDDPIKVSSLGLVDTNGNTITSLSKRWLDANGVQYQPAYYNVTKYKYTCGSCGSAQTCKGSAEDSYWMADPNGTCQGGCGAGIAKEESIISKIQNFVTNDDGTTSTKSQGENIQLTVKGDSAYVKAKYDSAGKFIGYSYVSVQDKINENTAALIEDIEEARNDAENDNSYSTGDFSWISTRNIRITGLSQSEARDVWDKTCQIIDDSCSSNYLRIGNVESSDYSALGRYKLGKYGLSNSDAYDMLRHYIADSSYEYILRSHSGFNDLSTAEREGILRNNNQYSAVSIIYTTWRDYAPHCDQNDPFFMINDTYWTSTNRTFPYQSTTEEGKQQEREEFKQALSVLLSSDVGRLGQAEWFADQVKDVLEYVADNCFAAEDTEVNEALLAYLSSMPFKLYSEGGYNVSSFGSTEMFTGQNLRCDIGYNTIYYDNGNSSNLRCSLRGLHVRFARNSGQPIDNNDMQDIYDKIVEKFEIDPTQNPYGQQ